MQQSMGDGVCGKSVQRERAKYVSQQYRQRTSMKATLHYHYHPSNLTMAQKKRAQRGKERKD
jgi:hypothetical protein